MKNFLIALILIYVPVLFSSPLFDAIRNEDDAAIIKILETDPEQIHMLESEMTAMHLAIMVGNLDIVILLQHYGASMENDEDGDSPLNLAAAYQNTALLSHFLTEPQGYIYSGNLEGYTALHYAAATGNLAVLVLLFESGHPIDPQDDHQATPLFEAVMNGNYDIANQLLQYGANCTLPTNYQNSLSPLSYAQENGLHAMVLLMEEHLKKSPKNKSRRLASSKPTILFPKNWKDDDGSGDQVVPKFYYTGASSSY